MATATGTYTVEGQLLEVCLGGIPARWASLGVRSVVASPPGG